MPGGEVGSLERRHDSSYACRGNHFSRTPPLRAGLCLGTPSPRPASSHDGLGVSNEEALRPKGGRFQGLQAPGTQEEAPLVAWADMQLACSAPMAFCVSVLRKRSDLETAPRQGLWGSNVAWRTRGGRKDGQGERHALGQPDGPENDSRALHKRCLRWRVGIFLTHDHARGHHALSS